MRVGVLSGVVTAALVVLAAGGVAVLHPDSPLPSEWNPTRPLDARRPPTPLTMWKVARAGTGAECLAALATEGAAFQSLPDSEVSDLCHIRGRVRLTRLGTADIASIETRCDTALRLALWVRHGLQPEADAAFGTPIDEILHLDSFSCRQIRTPSGSGGRMSLHATAEAIDITGVRLADGRTISLIEDWNAGIAGAFLRGARDTSCDWFATTLGPDYNSLHADHFHLQSRGWGLCR